jgi:predicted MFS family arabinose efflux permease
MGHRTIRTLAFVTILISTVFGPVQLALIVLARNTYHASPAAIGLIFSLAGGAGLLTTLFAPWTRRTFHVGHILITGMTLWAVGLLMMAAGPTLIFAAAGWMFISAVAGIQDVINVSYRLSLIPPNLQARVNSVYRFLVWGIRPAAIAGGGFLVASIGPRPLLWICAAGMMLTAMIAFLSPIRAAR